MSGRKRAYDEVDSSSAAAPTFASFFEYLAPELRSYVAAYCGPFMLPTLVAAGIVEFSEMDTDKRRVAYDATLVDSMRVWASRSCCFDLQDILHAFIGRYYGMIDDATRSAMCALFIDAVDMDATMENKAVSLERTVVDCIDSDDGAAMRVLAPLKSIRTMLIPRSQLSLLGYAAKCGSVECVRVLIANGADVDDSASEGRPALYEAVVKKNKQIVSLLLAAGANPNIHARFAVTPLFSASCTDQNYDIVRLLIQHGANINAVCPFGSALTNAISWRAHRVANLLIVHNADIHAHRGFYAGTPIVSPLRESILANCIDITRLLLQLGASPYDLSSLGAPVDDLIADMRDPSIRDNGSGTLDPDHAALVREASTLYVP